LLQKYGFWKVDGERVEALSRQVETTLERTSVVEEEEEENEPLDQAKNQPL
jgi:hypothetical protein